MNCKQKYIKILRCDNQFELNDTFRFNKKLYAIISKKYLEKNLFYEYECIELKKE